MPITVKKTTYVGCLIYVFLAMHILFAWRADLAMDKTGIGDYERFLQLSRFAGIAFTMAVLVWLITIGLLTRHAKRYRERGYFLFGLLPILLYFLVLGLSDYAV